MHHTRGDDDPSADVDIVDNKPLRLHAQVRFLSQAFLSVYLF
jgi:hypothetical protein